MLTPIAELSDKDAQMNAWGLGWTALDTDSGAYLFQTTGRTTTLPKYILILPSKTPSERRSLFYDRNFDLPNGRKIVRARTDEEAIKAANERLTTMLAQQAAAREAQP